MYHQKTSRRGNSVPTNKSLGRDRGTQVHVPKFRLDVENIRIATTRKQLYFVYDARKNKPVRLDPVFKIVQTKDIWHLIDLMTNETLHTHHLVADLIRYTDKNFDRLTRGNNV